MPRKIPASTAVEIETCMTAEVIAAPGRKRVFPAGWAGKVSDSVADQLRGQGALVDTDLGSEPEAVAEE
ncbi:hypothetical protein KO516_18330 [Citreicella sp. C3M06]|uniref:hypothetical protein n=1 Tax=Roseobacteraceae TaxID=2854170 RepID=UPI001C08795E|nr:MULTISPECIES: hypothetical protein [Roseobacteraceae]MBU2962749.1 hypothetical protein [Citreicella sp. C3M06]MDO6587704.1 hypothetical protein [Salipiger sp. 1_MG-2023]